MKEGFVKANTPKKQNAKKNSQQAKVSAPLMPKAKIQQQKVKYNLAAAKDDYLDKRIDNTAANKVRKSSGMPLYSSAIGDKQAALTAAKSPMGIKQLPIQAVKTALNQPAKTTLKPSTFRNAPTLTKITPEQQAKNQRIALQELKGKNGNIASFARGASLAMLDPFSLRNLNPKWRNEEQEKASSKNTFNLQSIRNPRAVAQGLQPAKITKSKGTYEGLGELAGSLIGVDPVGIGLEKGVSKGIQFAKDAKKIEKIPILKANGKIKFENVKKEMPVKNASISDTKPNPIQNASNKNTDLQGLNQAIQPQNIVKGTNSPMAKETPSNPGILSKANESLLQQRQLNTKAERAIPNLQDNLNTKALQKANEINPIPKPTELNTFVNMSKPQLKPLDAGVSQLPQTQFKVEDKAIGQQTLNRASNIPQRPFQSVGADLNKTPSKYKVSQFRTNTIENANQFANVKEQMPRENFEYEVRPEKVTLSESQQRLTTDFEGEVEDLYTKANFDGADTDTAMGIANVYGDEAEQTGNFTRLNNWSKQIQEKATEQGQAIQAFSKYTRTPEGKVIEGQKEVSKVQREIAKDNPRLTNKVNQETKGIIDAISGAEKETLENISEMINKMLKGKELTPSDLLARKVINTTKALKAPKENAINDMVNELFRVAKESPLPSTLKTKSNPVDYLTKAIQNKELYSDTWNKSKDVIKAKYKGKDQVLSMLDDYFDKGIIPTYSKATIDKSIRQTAKELTVDFSKIIKQSAGDKKKALQDITNLLINKTGATGEDAKLLAKNITDQYNKILKERTESTLKQMFREVPKKGQKTTYQKVMELINMGAYDNQSIKDIIRAKNKIPVLENEDIKGIFENMKLSEKATDPYMKRMYESKAQQIISDKIPADVTRKFAGLQRIEMLLNPKTLLTRNPGGNVLFAPVEMAKDIPASAIDRLVSLKTGQRTTTANPHIVQYAKGFKQGIEEWGKDIKYGVDTSPSRGQVELPNGRTFSNGFLHKLDSFIGKSLQLGDRPFYQAAYDSRKAELKKLNYPEENIDELAKAYALDKVFQNDSNLSKAMGDIRKIVDEKTGGIMGHLVLPFSQTPSNLLDKLLDYSPAGYIRAIAELGKTKNGIKQIGDTTSKAFDQKLFADRLGRALTGTGISLLGFGMASKGFLTGNEYDPTNKDLNAAKTKAGVPSYSIKVGDKYHSYEWIPVVGPLLAASADAYKAGLSGDEFIARLGVGAKSAINTVINQSMLQSIYSLFSGYDPASGMANTLLGSTSQFTQSGIANLAKVADPYIRETYDPNPIKKQGNKLLTRLPFASKTLPKKLDASGKPIMQSQGRGAGARALENFLLPQKVTEVKKDIVNNELLKLNKSTGENEMLLNVAPKKFTKGGQTYTLSAKDYTNYQKTMGQYANKQMDKLIKTDTYKKLSDADKVKALKKINDSATESARVEYFKNNGVSPLLALNNSNKKIEKYNKYIKGTGISQSQYIDLLSKIKSKNTDGKNAPTFFEAISALNETKLNSSQKQSVIASVFAKEPKK